MSNLFSTFYSSVFKRHGFRRQFRVASVLNRRKAGTERAKWDSAATLGIEPVATPRLWLLQRQTSHRPPIFRVAFVHRLSDHPSSVDRPCLPLPLRRAAGGPRIGRAGGGGLRGGDERARGGALTVGGDAWRRGEAGLALRYAYRACRGSRFIQSGAEKESSKIKLTGSRVRA